MNIKLSHIDQWKDTKNKKWAGRTCAICCLKMLLVFKDKKNNKLSIMDLVKEGLKIDGYIKGIGWKHKAIVALAGKYGIKMRYKRIFYSTNPQKLKGLKFIDSKIQKGQPVIASVFNVSGGGHTIIINGVKLEDGIVGGYFALDPDSRNNKKYINKKDFLNNWRGGLLWLL